MSEEISYSQQKQAKKDKRNDEVIVTRKVEIYCDKEHKPTLFKWLRMVRKSANMIMTNHYLMDNVSEMIYLDEGTKVKLADIKKDADGILTCSKRNTTYQIVSKFCQGEMPSGIMTSLNSALQSTYQERRMDIVKGDISLPSYRNNIPIPFQVDNMSDFGFDEVDGKCRFRLGGKKDGIPFTIFFGKDKSRNRLFFEKHFTGEYKLCDSSIKIESKVDTLTGVRQSKFFLLAVFKIPKKNVNIISDKEAKVYLDVNQPMIIDVNGRKTTVGSGEEFLHRRLAIQGALRRLQGNLRYAKGGKGRGKKMATVERYEKAEVDYVTNRIHNYTRKLIDICVEKNIGKIVLVNQKTKEAEAKADEKYLLRNWSYFGMKEKILYKAKMYGISVEEIELDENDIPVSAKKTSKKKEANPSDN